MAYYYKISDHKTVTEPPLEGIQAYEGNSADCCGPCIKYDFSKHVLIELLDNVTPEAKLWDELGLADTKNITHKRMIVDPHRINCRRAVVVCSSSDEASNLAQMLSQAKVMERAICAVVIQELLSDISLFEKQIIKHGDKRSQHQLVYVAELPKRHDTSRLAQYLRTKFSPFGNILSVLVSEDKDGYAHREGVIKFAHLSEAYAAELAYDQSAVALERLSVTTHHNVLLSQCDLRTRLKEAYSRQSSEFSFYGSPPESQIKNNRPKETYSDQPKVLPRSNSKPSFKEFETNESVLKESGNTINDNNEFLSDSLELTNVFKRPSESNLVDSLQIFATCSESSVSRRTVSDLDSLAETEPIRADQLGIPTMSNTSFSPPLKETLSSRILGWITDISNSDPSSQVDATTNDAPAENDFHTLSSSVSTDKDKNLVYNQQSKQTVVTDVSNSCFITYNNGVLNSSVKSILPSLGNVSGLNKVTMAQSRILSHSSECHPNLKSDEGISNANGSSVLGSTAINLNVSPVLSLKRKNSYMAIKKLYLRSKKMHNPEVLDSETTVHLPSVPKTKACSIVLNRITELDEIAKNLSLEQKPVRAFERLKVSQTLAGSSELNESNMLNIFRNKFKSKKFLKKGSGNDSLSFKSQSVRRSSRTRDIGKRSNCWIGPSEKNGVNSLASATKFIDKKESLSEETKSLLKIWLRKELDVSRNSQVTSTKESSKNVACASTNKDVLIYVGCSHMTCDFCYPDSTILLLGFH